MSTGIRVWLARDTSLEVLKRSLIVAGVLVGLPAINPKSRIVWLAIEYCVQALDQWLPMILGSGVRKVKMRFCLELRRDYVSVSEL